MRDAKKGGSLARLFKTINIKEYQNGLNSFKRLENESLTGLFAHYTKTAGYGIKNLGKILSYIRVLAVPVQIVLAGYGIEYMVGHQTAVILILILHRKIFLY